MAPRENQDKAIGIRHLPGLNILLNIHNGIVDDGDLLVLLFYQYAHLRTERFVSAHNEDTVDTKLTSLNSWASSVIVLSIFLMSA